MPTPLMPDEEFDAQFRQGLEHYPEQPENPAAWHRMGLLLDADLRQQALRRRVLRLLGAEAILLLLGVWATFSFLLEKLPIAGGQPPLATVGRAATSATPTAGAGRGVAVIASGQGTGELISSTSKTLLSKQPARAKEAASQLTGQTNTSVNKLSTAGKKTPHTKSISAATETLVQLDAASHAHKAGRTEGEKQLITRGNTLLAVSRSHRARYSGSNDNHATSEKTAFTTNRLAEANLKQKSSRSKHRLHQSTDSNAQKLMLAAGRKKTLLNTVASSFEKALPKAPSSLSVNNRRATATSKTAGDRAAASTNIAAIGQPIDLLAPWWPASDLHFQLPDSLALLALASTHPTDSLDPKPRPLLSAYRFRVGLIGAPEFSTVRADRLMRPGSSLGVMLEYQLGRRWRVSAGYLYTNKLYAARGTDYTLPAGYTLPHGYVISNVDAACRIVDIPLNLRFDLWQRPRYQVFVSAGLSSLLMRREQYTYDYELLYGKPVAPYSWELDNGSQHVLKVLNLSAGYERAVGLRWTVQAEPFVKLPLAGVGFGAVRLSSAGVFFSLKYGLLPVHPAPAPR